jgi:hypothetical protein
VTGADVASKRTPELETGLKGVFESERFLDLVRFIVFGEPASDVVKILAIPRLHPASVPKTTTTASATSWTTAATAFPDRHQCLRHRPGLGHHRLRRHVCCFDAGKTTATFRQHPDQILQFWHAWVRSNVRGREGMTATAVGPKTKEPQPGTERLNSRHAG